MRALRIVGLEDDGKTVICEDPIRGERFQIPVDERLRAAAKGDATRLGQIAVELESQMRPREIQARIRAGESVEQVASAAGLPEHRVERFAYPVLLERSRIADLAQRAHPVREDGPDVQTLGEVVGHWFSVRGQDFTEATWDSWKGEDGKWVVQLTWAAGRSQNRAHWTYHAGAHGGTVTPLDDHAHDLLDPNPNRPLRTVRPVTELAQQALELQQAPEQAVPKAVPQVVNGGEPARRPAAEPEVHTEQDFVEDFELTPEPEVTAVELVDTVERAEQRPEPEVHAPSPSVDREPEPEINAPSPSVDREPEPTPAPAPAARRSKGKKARPMVPSWEDVLLGTRSNRG